MTTRGRLSPGARLRRSKKQLLRHLTQGIATCDRLLLETRTFPTIPGACTMEEHALAVRAHLHALTDLVGRSQHEIVTPPAKGVAL